ncbi:MAG: HD domain-containing protein [Akkermansia sp.]|nr:HD domain-containing protein [Akkermansia sp.]
MMNPQPAITMPDYALTVVERLESRGYEAYVVGGCVRDSLLGRQPNDWDVCTNALPEDVLRVFRRFHVIKTGLQHGTVTVMSDRQPVEVTTFRIDGNYSDNRHPDAVSFVFRVEEDLARRDFTINAMAYSPTRGLVDAFGGQEDLAAGLIRCVGEPDARFNEDGLRIMRALRFAARFGFAIERETAASVRRNRHLLENVSAERIFKELKGILVGAGVLDMLLAFPEVFSCIIPELAPSIGFDQHTPYHCYDVWTHSAYAVAAAPADEILRLTLLLHDVGKPACFSMGEDGRGHFYGHPAAGEKLTKTILQRLKSDNATLSTVCALVRVHDMTMPTTVPGMRRLVGKLGVENVRRLLDVQRADHAAHSDFDHASGVALIRDAAELLEDVLEMEPAFTVKDLAINGNTLMQLGMSPGPAMRQVLETLLTAVQEGNLKNESETLSAAARKLI